MSRAANVPHENDLLCEGCGYVLNGLPDGANCPECGKPTDESVAPHLRKRTVWEDPTSRRGPIGRFLATTVAVLFRPTRFYRTLATREPLAAARRFAWIHWILASLLFGSAAAIHAVWYWSYIGDRWAREHALPIWIGTILLAAIMLALTTSLAARLTNWEATYRGLRLPLDAVLRSLYFHSAHYLPVGFLALITVGAFQIPQVRERLGPEGVITYLYVLSAEVIVAAGYLFKTYWIGMRNIMFANR